jgi:hypothetical protein
MMKLMIFFTRLALSAAFLPKKMPFRFGTSRFVFMQEDGGESGDVSFQSIAVSGFVSKESNFAEPYIFNELHAKAKYPSIAVITDDLRFARQRLVSPKTVYSGLNDVLEFVTLDDTLSLKDALVGKEAWLSFNVSTAQLPEHAKFAAEAGLKRAVFGVYLDESERSTGALFEEVTKILTDSSVEFTIMKFGDVAKMGESKFPYRITKGENPIPSDGIKENSALSSGDLMRVSLMSVLYLNAVPHLSYPGTHLIQSISLPAGPD